MKNTAKLVLVLLALIMASIAVSATPSMTVTDLSLGSTSQERSNSREDIETFVTGTITIQNTGTETLSNFGFSVSKGSKFTGTDAFDSSKERLQITNTSAFPATLNPGNSSTVTFKVKVPENLDAVDEDLKPMAFEVASVGFTASGTSSSASATSKVNLQAKNHLEIDKLVVKFDGSSDTVDNGDSVKDIKPGNQIEVVLDAKNTFSSKHDLGLQDVLFKMAISDDSAFSIDSDEEDVGDIDRGDTEQSTITMDVETDADKGTYTMEVFLEGYDEEYNSRHGEYWTVDLKVERESHDMQIESLVLSQQSVCAGDDVILTAKVTNMGRNTETDAALSLDVDFKPTQYIFATSKEITEELDEGDSTSQTITIPVPNEVTAGKYRVTLKAYYDIDQQTDDEIVYLTVESCAPVTPTPSAPVCGDSVCEGQETCSSCPSDCGACPTCNDGKQNQGETGVDCGGICPACPVVPPTGEVVQPPVTVVEEMPLYLWGLAAACGVLFVVIIIMMIALVRKR